MLNYFEIVEAKELVKKITKINDIPEQIVSPVYLLTAKPESDKIKDDIFIKINREKMASLTYKEDKLTEVLKNTCIRSNAKWGIITDGTGLPLSYFNLSEPEVYSAVCGIMLDAINKLHSLLNDYDFEYITIEVNAFYKIVFKKLQKVNKIYLLAYFLPAEVSEREEVMISASLIEEVLDE